MNLEMAIRDKLALYLDGSLQLEQLEDWLADRTWGVGAVEGAEALRELVGGVELAIAEYTNGTWDELQLRDHLGRELLSSYRVQLGDDQARFWLSDDAETLEESFGITAAA